MNFTQVSRLMVPLMASCLGLSTASAVEGTDPLRPLERAAQRAYVMAVQSLPQVSLRLPFQVPIGREISIGRVTDINSVARQYFRHQNEIQKLEQEMQKSFNIMRSLDAGVATRTQHSQNLIEKSQTFFRMKALLDSIQRSFGEIKQRSSLERRHIAIVDSVYSYRSAGHGGTPAFKAYISETLSSLKKESLSMNPKGRHATRFSILMLEAKPLVEKIISNSVQAHTFTSGIARTTNPRPIGLTEPGRE